MKTTQHFSKRLSSDVLIAGAGFAASPARHCQIASSRRRFRTAVTALAAWLVLGLVFPLSADQVPNPSVTASARPYNATFTAANLFDAGNAEFASLGQGPVSVPFTTETTNGTWVEMDFGSTVEFDRFVMRSRANAVDIVGQSRLIVSADPVFDASDDIFTFDPSGFNGAGPVQRLYRAVSGRYARWEVVTSGGGVNLGANQMWFLKTPAGHSLLPAPVVINASQEYNASYAWSNAADRDFGFEYASLGAQAGMFIDFDLGAEKAITGFEFLNRYADRVTTFELQFANEPGDLGSFPLATLSFTASTNGNFVNSATFDAINARYVRLQATGSEGADNTGVREIQFFTVPGQTPAITGNPAGGTRLVGDALRLSASAIGDFPMTWQWYHDGVPVAEATNSALVLTNLQADDAGNYEAVASNSSGSATTAPPALLTILNPPVDLTSDLRLWLKFDDPFGGVAIDDSGNARDGTLMGFPGDDSQWVTGRIDGAIRVNPDGANGDDVVLVPDDGGLDFSSTLAFTLAAWVNGATIQEAGAPVLAKGTGAGGEQYALDMNAGAYRFYVRTDTGAAVVFQTPVAPNSTWQHLVVVYSVLLNRVKVYVNGTEVLSATPAATLLQNYHEVSVGSRQAAAGAYDRNFDGTLDEVRIYARALTPDDVTALYHLASLVPPSIVSAPTGGTYFAFDTTALTVVADGSAPLSYQWSKDDSPINGATNATLPFPSLTTNDAGSYTVSISNSRGSTNSAPAVLVVNDPVPALTDGLVLHFKFDENSGTTAADASGHNHDGLLQNFADPPWTSGVLGGALAFNPEGGTGDDVVLVTEDGGLDFSSALEFSLATWANGGTAQDSGAGLIAKGTGAGGEQYSLDIYNGSYRFYVWNASATATVLQTPVSADNTWQHVAAVFSRSQNRMRVYLNGQLVASGTPPATLVQNLHEVSIGSRQAGTGAYDLNFSGALDDVRIYNRAITPREIASLHDMGVPPRLTIIRSGNEVTLSWPASVTAYVLESSDRLPAASWTTVDGVVNNAATVNAGPGDRFFRLRKP